MAFITAKVLLKKFCRASTLSRGRVGKTAQITLANLDQVVVVLSVREPELNTHRLDRFLVLAESNDLKSLICFNKIDLMKKRELKKEIAPIQKLYESLGYPVVLPPPTKILASKMSKRISKTIFRRFWAVRALANRRSSMLFSPVCICGWAM